jgi:hypothetical protein
MICPKCHIEGCISYSKEIKKENSKDVYFQLNFKCRNPRCENFQKIIGEEIKVIK